MANAIIDTLRTKNTSGEEHILYPRSKTSAISDNNGKNLDVILSELDDKVANSEFNDVYTETSINLGRKADTEIGTQSVAIGVDNTVVGVNSIAVGENNVIDETKFTGWSDYASNSIVVGKNNIIDCSESAAIFGNSNKLINSGDYSFYNYGGTIIAGINNVVSVNAYNTVFGNYNQLEIQGDNEPYGCFVSGYGNKVTGSYALAIGYSNDVGGDREASIAIGRDNTSTSTSSIALGSYCKATEQYALAGGSYSISSGLNSFAYGADCNATAYSSVALGYSNKATNDCAFTVGRQSVASGYASIAMGYETKATAYASVSIGDNNEANAHQSLALGARSIASGNNSIAIGYFAKSSGEYQTAMGRHNIEDTENKYALIFGGGEYSTPKNIHTLDWDGNAVFAGKVADGNGATISGIETTTDTTIDTNVESLVHINSIKGRMSQDIDSQTLVYPLFTSVIISTDSETCAATSTDQIMLFGMNDVYDIIKDNKLTSRYQKIVLNGSENITLDSVTGCFLFSPTVKAKVSTKNISSNRYKYFETNTYDTNYGLFVLETGQIGINHDEFSTVDEYKTWLASNNVTIVYEKETEEIIDLDETFVNELNNLKLFIGENTITTNSTTSLNPIIEVDYATSKMAKYVLELLSIMKNTKNAEGGAY